MTCDTSIYSPHRMNLVDFGDSLTSPSTTTSRLTFLTFEISEKLQDKIAMTFGTDLDLWC